MESLIVFGFFGLLVLAMLAVASGPGILEYLEKRRKDKMEHELKLAEINKEREIKQTQTEDAYWRELSNLPKRAEA